MQPKIGSLYTFENPTELAENACQSFCDLAKIAIDANGVFRVALSGGSTPQKLYKLLNGQPLEWDKIELFWGDERNVPRDHEDSNYRMVKLALLEPAQIPETSAFPVPTTFAAPIEVALEYERILKSQFQQDEAWPSFDLVLLGMGDDAHTASLFPQTDALQDTTRWFTSNWVAKLDSYRYTLTAPAINAAANVWFLITGENKRQALANVWSGPRDASTFPSQLINPEEGLLWWLVSQEALPE